MKKNKLIQKMKLHLRKLNSFKMLRMSKTAKGNNWRNYPQEKRNYTFPYNI